ncbi:MAG: hypothetical protein M5U32_06540 [Myxococcota bacterium]|nr:hypothetical protein [Myxococcota bacterium]
MGDAANRIVQKLWSYCHVLHDDGLSYQGDPEQLTFLLFLEMAGEHAQWLQATIVVLAICEGNGRRPKAKPSGVPILLCGETLGGVTRDGAPDSGQLRRPAWQE